LLLYNLFDNISFACVKFFLMQSIYVRVKRGHQTIFLNTEPTDTVNDVKGKLSGISKVPTENIRLIFNNNALEESKCLGDLKIENDSIINMVFKKEGTNDFEDVQKADESKQEKVDE